MNSNESSQLIHIQIANPCRADWEAMEGNGAIRACQTCQKNVYNISEMNRVAAEKMIRENEGNLCVRFYQRADGTIITDDCPVGLKIVKRPLQWLSAAVATVAACVIGLMPGAARANPVPSRHTAPTPAPVKPGFGPGRGATMGLVPRPQHKRLMGHFPGGITPPHHPSFTLMGSPPALGPKPTPAPTHKPIAHSTTGEVAPHHPAPVHTTMGDMSPVKSGPVPAPVQVMGLIAVSPSASQ